LESTSQVKMPTKVPVPGPVTLPLLMFDSPDLVTSLLKFLRFLNSKNVTRMMTEPCLENVAALI
jgi:hypothetical protein